MGKMASSSSNSRIALLFSVILIITTANFNQTLGDDEGVEKGTSRVLLGFKENPAGSNTTFQCSPSGPCVPCLYSEKNDERYRCSETGYRIPLKCTELESKSKDPNAAKAKTKRNMLDDSSKSTEQSQPYITYRSCIPPANEEKLSVLGFEGIVLCFLAISGSVIYIRKKQALAMSNGGAMRIPTSSRF